MAWALLLSSIGTEPKHTPRGLAMLRHRLLMLLCCALPLGLIFLLPYVGVTLSGGLLLGLIVLLCPLVNLLIAGRGGGACRCGESGGGGTPQGACATKTSRDDSARLPTIAGA